MRSEDSRLFSRETNLLSNREPLKTMFLESVALGELEKLIRILNPPFFGSALS